MKRLGLTTLGFLSVAALLWARPLGTAQDPRSQSSIPVPIPPGGGASYLFVTNRSVGPGGEGVTVFDASTDPPTRVTGIPHASWNSPTAIVEVPALNFVVVLADRSAGVVTFIDSLTFSVLGTVTVPGINTLESITVAPDQSMLFVTGQTNFAGNDPAVFRLALQSAAPFGVPQPPIVFDDNGASARDCAVLRAGSVGGSGNGPGKVFFSVPVGGASGDLSGYLVAADLVGGTTTPLDVGTAPLPNVTTPTEMDSAPDDSVVFVACTTVMAAASNRAIRVDGLTNARSEMILTPGLTNTAPHSVVDVSFRFETSAIRAYFVTGVEDTNGNRIHQRDGSGAQISLPVTLGGINPRSIRHSSNPTDDSLYIGNAVGGQTTFEHWDSSAAPPASPGQLISGTCPVATPTNFAFAVNPKPQIFDVCPKGGTNAANTRVVVLGAEFVNGARVRLIDLAGTQFLLNTTAQTSNLIDATLAGPVTQEEMTVRVTNPDGQFVEFKQYFTTCNLPPANFSLTLPTRVQGYQMLSVPAYADSTALRTGLEAALGPYNRFFYRVFFRNAAGDYVEAPDQPADACELSGNAFWVITRFGAQITVSGLDGFANASNGTRSVKLVPGWNMISMPYRDTVGGLFRMSWVNVMTTPDGAGWGSQLTAADPSRITQGLLFEFANGAYATVNVLEAGKGYFVHNGTGAPLFLLYNAGSIFKPGQGPEPSYGAVPPGIQPPPPPGDVDDVSSDSGGSCGLLGPELLVLGLARLVWRRGGRRRRLGA